MREVALLGRFVFLSSAAPLLLPTGSRLEIEKRGFAEDGIIKKKASPPLQRKNFVGTSDVKCC